MPAALNKQRNLFANSIDKRFARDVSRNVQNKRECGRDVSSQRKCVGRAPVIHVANTQWKRFTQANEVSRNRRDGGLLRLS